MGMGWHKLSIPIEEVVSSRACKCGKGKITTIQVTTEESEFPPFEKGYTRIDNTCPDKCEK